MGEPGSHYHLSGKMERSTQSFWGGGQLLPGRTARLAPSRGRGGEGPGVRTWLAVVAAARSPRGGDERRPLPPCVAGLQRGCRAGSGPLPLSWPGCLLPSAAASPPARPPRSFSPPPAGDGGSPGQGPGRCPEGLLPSAAPVRTGWIGALQAALGLGFRGGAEGTAPGGCGAALGRAGRGLSPGSVCGSAGTASGASPPRAPLLLRGGGQRSRPRLGGLRWSGPGGGGGVSRRGAEAGEAGRRGAGQLPRNAAAARAAVAAARSSPARSASSPPLSGHGHTARAAALAPGGRRRAGS